MHFLALYVWQCRLYSLAGPSPGKTGLQVASNVWHLIISLYNGSSNHAMMMSITVTEDLAAFLLCERQFNP
jgi:hypothetical protein